MSLKNECVMSSATSVSGVESFSDIGSTSSVRPDKIAMTGLTGASENSPFDFGDGDFQIVSNGTTLETHKFLVKRFAGLKDRIEGDTITLDSGEPGLEVFRNIFKILYASVIEGPFEFDHTTLTSALLLATKYDYPALRTFAITNLENTALSPVERIRLAREFDIPSWEEPAYLELCERDEALTMLEAGVLGLEVVVHVVAIREKEQRRRGKEVDAAEELKGRVAEDHNDGARPIDAPATQSRVESSVPTATLPKSDDMKRTEAEMREKDNGITLKPCFIDLPVPSAEILQSSFSYSQANGRRIMLNVPGCRCEVPYSDGSKKVCQCKLPPCAVSAFKHLQTTQRAHRSNISALENAVEQIHNAIFKTTATADLTTGTSTISRARSGILQDDVRNWLACKRREHTRI